MLFRMGVVLFHFVFHFLTFCSVDMSCGPTRLVYKTGSLQPTMKSLKNVKKAMLFKIDNFGTVCFLTFCAKDIPCWSIRPVYKTGGLWQQIRVHTKSKYNQSCLEYAASFGRETSGPEYLLDFVVKRDTWLSAILVIKRYLEKSILPISILNDFFFSN